MNQPDIVIKEANKGRAVTVLSKNHYRAMVYEHFNNQNTYQKLDKNLDSTIMKKLKKLLNKHKSISTDKEFKYLNETDYNTSNFYGLPKIHKSQLITNTIKEQNSEVVSINEPQDLKVRPIVGAPKCPTRKLSELIDTLLKPFLKPVESYLRDSIDIHNKCDRNTDGNTVTATFDVVGLYTNIPQTFGMEAVRYFLLKYKEDIHPRFNIPFILESIDFILKNNTCVFDNEYFLQLQGTAMGTVCAPTYANLSMGYHEIKLYDLIKFNYNLDIGQYFVENWKRLQDDCEILLNTDLIKPDDLLTIINSVNNDIQFSTELNDNKLPFLDILTAQKMKFSIKDFSSKSFLRIWSRLLTKAFMENFIFCAVSHNKIR